MFCSTIIPTIGRPSLNRAVNSVLSQDFAVDDFEIIVVNDSGRPLPAADWQQSPKVKLLQTQQRERSVARNTGAAIARGKYLHFLDDDDWLLPGALTVFWSMANQVQDTAWLVGGSQLVDRDSEPIIQLHPQIDGNCFLPVMSGEWYPLQSSIIKTDVFFSIGGFNPDIPGIEDVDLARRVTFCHDLAVMPDLVACIGMGPKNSSTNRSLAQNYGRKTREFLLDAPGTFKRMRSFPTNSFWHGRITRIYLTSVVWNWQHRQPLQLLKRVMVALLVVVLAWRHLLSTQFWRAVARPYKSATFAEGFLAAGKHIEY